jgi:hypothetical protein
MPVAADLADMGCIIPWANKWALEGSLPTILKAQRAASAVQARPNEKIDSISLQTAASWFRREFTHVSAVHVIWPRGPPNMMVMNGMTSEVSADFRATSA